MARRKGLTPGEADALAGAATAVLEMLATANACMGDSGRSQTLVLAAALEVLRQDSGEAGADDLHHDARRAGAALGSIVAASIREVRGGPPPVYVAPRGHA